MNASRLKGKFRRAKGKIKERVGRATRNSKLEGQGVADQVIGQTQEGYGEAKDRVKDAVDTAFGD
ncbi:MAG: CsbD family protein [Deltaproteobacteria bacterium]|nr:CsbD family protein [Deltaproteobacteria bacterium]MBI3293267.1 CsbD family protein [Deltaproteobacteria bacterium]